MIRLVQLLLLISIAKLALADYHLLLLGPAKLGPSPCCSLSPTFQNCYEERYETIQHQLACSIKVTIPWQIQTVGQISSFAIDIQQQTGFQLIAITDAEEQEAFDDYYHIYVDALGYNHPDQLKAKIEDPKYEISVMLVSSRSPNSFIIKIKNPFDLDKPEWNRMIRLLNSWGRTVGGMISYGILYPPKTGIQGYFLWSETTDMKEARMKGVLAEKVKEFCCPPDLRVLECNVVDYESFFKAAVFACWTRLLWYNSNPLQSAMIKLWTNKPDYIYSVISANELQMSSPDKFEFDVQLVTRRQAVKPDFEFEYFTDFAWAVSPNNNKLRIELTNMEDKNIILHGRWLQAILILAQIEKHTEITTSLVPMLNYPRDPKSTNIAMQARREVLLLVRDDFYFQKRDPCTLLDPNLDSERAFTQHDCRSLDLVPVTQNTYNLYLVHLNVWITPNKFEHLIINRNLHPDTCTTTVISTLSSVCYGSYRVIDDDYAQAGASSMQTPKHFQIIVSADVNAVMELYNSPEPDCPWLLDQLNGVCRDCAEGYKDGEYIEFRLECEYFVAREVLPRVMEINKKLNEGSNECIFNVRFFHEFKNKEDAARASASYETDDCFNHKIYQQLH